MPRSLVTLQHSCDWSTGNARHYIRLWGVLGMNMHVLLFASSVTSLDAAQH